jgi:hypothetical protein
MRTSDLGRPFLYPKEGFDETTGDLGAVRYHLGLDLSCGGVDEISCPKSLGSYFKSVSLVGLFFSVGAVITSSFEISSRSLRSLVSVSSYELESLF